MKRTGRKERGNRPKVSFKEPNLKARISAIPSTVLQQGINQQVITTFQVHTPEGITAPNYYRLYFPEVTPQSDPHSQRNQLEQVDPSALI